MVSEMYTISIKINAHVLANNKEIAKNKGIQSILDNLTFKYLDQFVSVEKK